MKWRVLVLAAAIAVVAGCLWLWDQVMTERLVAVPYKAQAAIDNPLLAGTRLLTAHGHAVRVEKMLEPGMLAALPRGTLLLTGGAVDAAQAAPLLAWARRGNTLVVRPGWIGRAGGQTRAAADTDAIGSRYGVALSSRTRQDDTCRALRRPKPAPDDDAHLVCVTPPDYDYPLELSRGLEVLQPEDDANPLWGDEYGLGVLVFAEGRGHVVVVAQDYFSDEALGHFDHGELLLVLAGLAGPRTPVLAVNATQSLTWMQLLWQRFWPALCAAAVALALWAWAASRRFGPAIPAPAGERRALLEHIDASGRWLWQVPGGRDVLLAAVRRTVMARLQRRAPELLTLDAATRVRRLAELAGLSADDVDSALHAPPAQRAADFTHQISTLQRLRAHHER